jgi:NADH-quinone oxidoreductase subunit M
MVLNAYTYFSDIFIKCKILNYKIQLYNFDLNLVLYNLNILFLFILIFIFIFSIIYIKINQIFLKNLLYIYIIILFFILNIIFLTDNLLIFFLFFEASLIPLILIILSFGSRNRKLYATFLLFYYTIFGSIFFFASILLIYYKYKTFSINDLVFNNLEIKELTLYNKIIFLFLFLSFCIKIPIVPFHTWLTEAHVEAPTIGSILLASLILKVGVFAFLRILFPIFYEYCFYYKDYIIFLFFMSLLHSSFVILSIYDVKKIIAYFSIIHMNFSMIGFFTFNLIAIEGSLLLTLSHSFSSTLLFFLIGLLYDSFKTRNLSYFSGLNYFDKKYSFYFFVAILLNIGFPFTICFIGEFKILYGLFFYNPYISLFIIIPLFFNFIISMLLYTKLFFGSYILEFYDKKKKIFIFKLLNKSKIYNI